ncbi:MAG TPA: hypothetical protein VIL30_07225 [Ramlibacter sp.]|jgi:hypothetical protein
MRAIFSVVSLLVVVAVIGVLAKKQLSAGVAPPASTATTVPGVATPTGTPRQQQEQFKQAIEGAMQQARPMPDEPK